METMSTDAPDARRTRTLVGHVVRRGIPTLLLIGVLAAAYYVWRHVETAPQPVTSTLPQEPVPVTVTTVTPETVPIEMKFLGTTEAAQRVEIRARVAGYLMPRKFTEGQQVEQGDELLLERAALPAARASCRR